MDREGSQEKVVDTELSKEQLLEQLQALERQLDELTDEKQVYEVLVETITEHSTDLENLIFEKNKELTNYFQHVEKITNAAATVETDSFIPESLDDVAARPDELGQLARVLQQMVSQVKAREAALKTALQESQAKTNFIVNMSHELRTPLNAILGFSQLLARETTFTTRQRDQIDIINRSGEHLLALINDVLEVSKIEAGKVILKAAVFDLRAMLKTLEALFTARIKSKQLRFGIEVDAQTPSWIQSDESKLRQILVNLIGNAIKFTHSGGITVRVRPEVDLTTSIASHQMIALYFEVEDSGEGIDPEELDKLFTPYEQTASGVNANVGTGLGLSISRKFAQLMGGDLGVRSQKQAGSTFYFKIMVRPESQKTSVELQPRVIGLAPAQPSYRILVVDDNAEDRDLLVQLLVSVGLTVRSATSGEEALAVLPDWQPHLIWMDICMPGMNGYEATQRIKAYDAAIIVIAITASALDHERQAILASGCDDFVSKPFKEATLFATMAQHLPLQYDYEPAGAAPVPTSPLSLTPSSLAIMSPDWISSLRHASLVGKRKSLLKLIQQIPTSHAALANRLADLTNNYQFDQITSLAESCLNR